MKKIKIAHIITSLEQGGAQEIVYTIVSQLPEFDHIIIYFKAGPYLDRFKKLGVITYQLKGIVSFIDPFALIRLLSFLYIHKITIIHGILWSSNLLSRYAGYFLGLPTFLSLHNMRMVNGLIRNTIDRLTNVGNPTYIAVTKAIAQELEAFHSSRQRSTVRVIQNGINAQEYALLRLSKSLDKKDYFIFGAVGRLVPIKNYLFLIGVFFELYKKYPQVRLHIVGSGFQENQLIKLIEQLKLQNIVFLHTKNKSAKEFYSMFDCFVQPSLSEGLSLALLEAMAAGVPPIAVGATHELVKHHETGLLVYPLNNKTLFSTLEWALHNNDLLCSFATAAQSFITNHYSSQQMINKYKKAFLC